MKLIKKQIDEQTEIEVEIRFAEMNDEVAGLIQRIEKGEKTIYGTDNGRHYVIKINDIHYVENVDKKTFIYTKDSVFRSELRLYRITEMLSTEDFVQVSKSCVVNINIIESLQSLANSRLQATLSNGEKINVSRKFLPKIKAAFFREEGEWI